MPYKRQSQLPALLDAASHHPRLLELGVWLDRDVATWQEELPTRAFAAAAAAAQRRRPALAIAFSLDLAIQLSWQGF